MRVETLGEGRPTAAIVGGVHGDEPCGARAIERLIDEAPVVDRPVKLIIANEAALDAGVRFIDADLNRAFEDVNQSNAHEHALARRLADELEGAVAMSIHSTQSHPRPFGIVNGIDEVERQILPQLTLDAVVDVDDPEGRLFAVAADLIEVEAGRQGSERATEMAYRLSLEFLSAIGARVSSGSWRAHPVYSLGEPIAKPPAETYEVLVENFTRVAVDEVFATADGDPIAADRSFYPILTSAYGYTDILGYAGDAIGELDAEPDDGRPIHQDDSTSASSRSR